MTHKPISVLASALIVMALAGCAGTSHQLAGSGPSAERVIQSQTDEHRIQVVEVTPAVAKQILAAQKTPSFGAEFDGRAVPEYVIGRGDQVEVVIWEASPATLFGSLPEVTVQASSRAVTLPAQMVGSDDEITVPFVGRVKAAGRAAKAVEKDIVGGLRGKANQPQALVRVVKNATADVTVVGEVTASTRMPLTARGERLLDAIAAAGGVKQPVEKVTAQISRGSLVRSVPLEAVIRDPAQNVRLQSGDVVTAYYQPLSFTALGAVGKSGEINIEATGVTLSQALARVGGVLDNRADTGGVFLFRQEEKGTPGLPASPENVVNGKVPVIYRVDLRDPAAFIAMRDFPVKDKDVLYVSNASLAELQKFMNVVASIVYPVANLHNLAQD